MKRTPEQLVDLRCRIYEFQQQQERAQREKALQQNKKDVTAAPPTPPAPQAGKTLSFTIKRR